jgi:hypothetical protein
MLETVGRRIRAARTRQRGYAMQHAVQAAIARFPDRGHAIEELVRDLVAELAAELDRHAQG